MPHRPDRISTTGENRPRSVRWLVQGSEHLPSVRFRVLPMCHRAGLHGWQAEVHRYPKTLLARLAYYARQVGTARKVDVVVLQKRLLSRLEVFFLRQTCSRLVYDFDDAVWTDQDAPDAIENGKHKQRFLGMCRSADLVIAANKHLAAAVPQGKATLILPTPIDTTVYTPGGSDEAPAQRSLVGWMGTSSYLPDIFPVAQRISLVTGQALALVSNARPDWATAHVCTFQFWSPENELSCLRSFAIGLMPLPDTQYSLGKGGFKLLQYMACGAVPVASAVGFNREIIRHGENGFLVDRFEDWEHYVRLLLADTALRLRLTAAALETVRRRFDCAEAAESLFYRLEQINFETLRISS